MSERERKRRKRRKSKSTKTLGTRENETEMNRDNWGEYYERLLLGFKTPGKETYVLELSENLKKSRKIENQQKNWNQKPKSPPPHELPPCFGRFQSLELVKVFLCTTIEGSDFDARRTAKCSIGGVLEIRAAFLLKRIKLPLFSSCFFPENR